jgi:hypothetical protein
MKIIPALRDDNARSVDIELTEQDFAHIDRPGIPTADVKATITHVVIAPRFSDRLSRRTWAKTRRS